MGDRGGNVEGRVGGRGWCLGVDEASLFLGREECFEVLCFAA